VIIEEVRTALVDRGFTIVENVPVPSAAERQIVLLESEQVQQVSTIYRLSSVATQWLIWVALALLAASILVGQRRSRWVSAVGWSIAIGSLIVGVMLAAGKEAALASVGAAAVSAQASLLDAITRYLAGAARSGFAFGVVLIIVGWLMGRSKAAWVIRESIGSWEQAIADRIRSAWPGVGSGGEWFKRAATGLRVAIVAVALLSIFGRADLSAGRVVWTFVIALVAWLVVDLLARTAPRDDATAPPESSAPAESVSADAP
jgi:hypothetical protein